MFLKKKVLFREKEKGEENKPKRKTWHVYVQENAWKGITKMLKVLLVGNDYKYSILFIMIFLNLSFLQSSCIMLTSI